MGFHFDALEGECGHGKVKLIGKFVLQEILLSPMWGSKDALFFRQT